MYEKHFNFSANPFTIAPNPRYLYMTVRHREALAHLTYGLQENGGFILLTGEVGTGKTTVCRCLLSRVPDEVNLALVLTPSLSVNELLEVICDEFDVKYEKGATNKTLTDVLNHYLLDIHAQGQRAVVVIDEAQNLDIEVLEQLRLLTNLETNERKLLQIILIGQPEFLKKLAQSDLRQLSQRIVARFHLTPLKIDEVQAYINHRIKIAGGSTAIFSRAVALRIAQLSKGVPRLINLLCDRALLGCYVQDLRQVDIKTLNQAAHEVFGDPKVLRQQQAQPKSRSWLPRYLPRIGWARPAITVAAIVAIVWGGALLKSEQIWQRLPMLGSLKSAEIADMPSKVAVDRSGDLSGTVEDTVMVKNRAEKTVAMTGVVADSDLSAQPLTWESLMQVGSAQFGAYASLFQKWNIQYSPDSGKTPCGFALQEQLDCWHKRGSFKDLQYLNRPALLKMVSAKGELFYAALLEVNGNKLRLGFDRREMEVSRSEFERWWTSEFTLLWKRPREFVRTLQPGEKNAFSTWVEERISRFEGRKVANSSSQIYGFALAKNVRSLQRRCGLRVDGLVGRETIILINSLTSKVPMLSKNSNRRCARRLNV